jgi:hypothetical protein
MLKVNGALLSPARVRWFDEYADGGMGPTLTGKDLLQAGDEDDGEGARRGGNRQRHRRMPNYLAYLEKELGPNDYLVANTFTLGTRSPRVQNSRATDNGAARLRPLHRGAAGRADRIARPYRLAHAPV